MIEMETIQDFFIVLVALLGFVYTVGGIINMIRNWHKESKIQAHEKILADHEDRLRKLEKETDKQDKFIKVLCQSMLAIISHEINGNSIDKLKEAQSNLEQFLVNK